MKPEIERALDELRAQFAARLPARLHEILDAIRGARARSPAEAKTVRQLAHRLHGSSGSYGFAHISAALVEVEAICSTTPPALGEAEIIVMELLRGVEHAP